MDFDIQTVARIVDIPTSTIYSMIYTGTIKRFHEIGRHRDRYRFSEDDVAALLMIRDFIDTLGIERKLAAAAVDAIIDSGRYVHPETEIKITADFERYRQKILEKK